METVWYVYKRCGGPPSYRHPSYESAVTEAKRLVDMMGGQYEILEVKALVEAAPKHVVTKASHFFRSTLTDFEPPF